MEACERVDRTRDRIQTALRYTKSLLSDAEPIGLLHLSNVVKSQMQLLHATASRPDDVDVLLKFETNPARFEEALNNSYGYFVQRGGSGGSGSIGAPSKPVSSLGLPTPSSTPQPPSPTHSSPLEVQSTQSSMGYGMSSALKNDLTQSGLLSSMADLGNSTTSDLSSSIGLSSYPSSMPTSASSLRALDLNSLGSVGSMTSIQEYNLQQLASLAGKAECQNAIQSTHGLQHSQQSQQSRQAASLLAQRGTPSPHPTSPFTLADLLAGDVNATSHALSNLQALAKLGSHGIRALLGLK